MISHSNCSDKVTEGSSLMKRNSSLKMPPGGGGGGGGGGVRLSHQRVRHACFEDKERPNPACQLSSTKLASK